MGAEEDMGVVAAGEVVVEDREVRNERDERRLRIGVPRKKLVLGLVSVAGRLVVLLLFV